MEEEHKICMSALGVRRRSNIFPVRRAVGICFFVFIPSSPMNIRSILRSRDLLPPTVIGKQVLEPSRL